MSGANSHSNAERPIAVGDLVQIVRWDCCGGWLGGVFRVSHFENSDIGGRCSKCSKGVPAALYAFEGTGRDYYSAPVGWLKRIPPLDELEGQRTEEDIHEPA